MGLCCFVWEEFDHKAQNQLQQKWVIAEKATYLSIYLLTYMGVFGLDFVSKLLPDEAAQTHNPYTILNPYHMWML